MNHHQINYMIAKQRNVELQRAGARARLARDVPVGPHHPRGSKPITCLSLRLAGLTRRFAPTRP
jgi:hypothetical protein